VAGITKEYKIFFERNKFKFDVDPVKFFDSIDLSDEYYFKYKVEGELKEYQNILFWGIKGNGKSLSMQWFAEKFCEQHKCKATYFEMANFIETLLSLDLKEKRSYTQNLLKKYKLICIDEIDKIKITEYAYVTIFNFLNNGHNNMNNFVFGSNLDKENLTNFLGENIMSRIDNKCLIVKNQGVLLR
jgi:DNA replication protein DnaC